MSLSSAFQVALDLTVESKAEQKLHFLRGPRHWIEPLLDSSVVEYVEISEARLLYAWW